MNWIFNSNDDKHKLFLDAIETMLTIHLDTASCEHGIKTQGADGYRKFTPTSFVYAFFEFNILYNYDWFQSIDAKKLISYDDDDYDPTKSFRIRDDEDFVITEMTKIKSFIRFCFIDDNFSGKYRDDFYRVLSRIYNDDEIKEAINNKTIKIDETIDEKDKEDFIEALYNILDDGCGESFRNDIISCLSFIYKVRCRLFHGHKTIRVIEDNSNQRTKLTIYYYFIIAVCQMFYSLLNYKKVPYITENFEKNSFVILCDRMGLK